MAKIISVNLKERAYKIHIEPGIIKKASVLSSEFIKGKNIFILTDDNVNKLYGENILKSLSKQSSKSTLYSIPPGEGSKTLATMETLYHEVLKAGLDRKSVIIALGGGVVGDIAGFLAASYMRGIDFIQIPTSLLAMVDSSVGGKTGIDLPEGKNLIGAFWQPKVVLIDPEVLSTLPKRELHCGLAEVVKYGMIFDENFFLFLENNIQNLKTLDYSVYTEVISQCCNLKADVVCKDEREESGLRALLNYGHTFGHAIETVTGYETLNHGEGVAIGMCMAASLSVADNRLDDVAELRQEALLRNLSLPCSIAKVKPKDIYEAMYKDKKTLNGKLRFVLPETIGDTIITEIPEKKLIMTAIGNCCDR
jgi:3-dehydroquinate synthase